MEDELARMRAAMDQARAQSAELAKLVASYMRALHDEGVNGYDALELAKALQHDIATANVDEDDDE